MNTGTYVGPIPALRGKRALLQPSDGGNRVLAQFNYSPPELNENNDGGPYNFLCFGWHAFNKGSFEIDQRGNDEG